MTLTTAEKRLLALYYSGSVRDTADVVREAISEIYAPDERGAAVNLLRKLEGITHAEFNSFDPETGCFYE